MRLLLLVALCAIAAVPVRASDLFDRSNLIAWCIVPFDAKKRGPEERAAMLAKLGFKHFAYDYRAEHVPTWDAELEALKRHGVELSAWWFRTKLDDEAKATLELFRRHKVRPQLWVNGGGEMTKTPEEQQARVETEVKRLRPIAEAAAEIGCKVALYNHGGWFGEPENQIAIIERLRRAGVANVGIVYNLHHGHAHLDRFPELLAKMQPHLLALNLNGMTRGADLAGKKIMVLGQGEEDARLLRVLRESGWRGLVGILNHTGEDAETRLRANLEGLQTLLGKPNAASPAQPRRDIFAQENLVAWCIVIFDPRKPAPEERAAMLAKLGIKRFGYEYRPEQVPSWEAELEALKRHGIELTAWWFPGALNAEARQALALFQRHGVKPQLWVRGGEPAASAADQPARVEAEALRLQPIAAAAADLGLQVALYNHGGWGGEPENQLEVIARLRGAGLTNVGIVYNLHHGHDHLDRFPALLAKMQPHLLALNLNGMTRGADRTDGKILPLGQGELDLQLLRAIRDSGWSGPVGILNHTGHDPAARLRDNLDGLAWLAAQLDGQPAGPKPIPRSWRDPRAGAKGGATFVIPAAPPDALTRANGWPVAESFRSWTRSLGGPTSNRFSALTQIDKTNVARLEVAWIYRSGDGAGNLQCNPIVVDGVMFAPTPAGFLVALDAATGRELWRYRREQPGKRLEDAVARRGLLHWPGDAEHPARIIFGAGDWLYALDPKTGQPLESFGEGGRTPITRGATTVGAVYRHMLVVAGYHDNVFGYDVRTGALRWSFRTKPAKGEYGAETWSKIESGANCWGGIALDESRGIAYIGLGSPKPNFFGMGHLGDNLFSNCVLALDAQTGRRLWHFQELRHDIWDWDIPAPPNLVTVERHGMKVDAVAQVTKLGNTLLLDRVTGQPLYDFKFSRVATKALPGDVPAPYQPTPELPQPFSRQAYTMADLPASPEAQAAVLPLVLRANLGPFPSLEEAKPTLLFNIHGGAEWTGAAADPRGRLYVTANEIPWHITPFRDDDPEPAKPPTAGEGVYGTICFACHGPERKGIAHSPPLRGLRHRMQDAEIRALLKTGRGSMPPMPQLTEEQIVPLLDFLLCRDRPITGKKSGEPAWTFGGWNRLVDHEGYPGCTPPWGTLTCLDLNTGRIAWQKPLGEYDGLTKAGVAKTGQENFGGATVTAGGLVFVSGTRDKKIRAFDADHGAELWSHPLELHGTAPPTSYEAGGRQFIALPASGGGKLGGPVGDAWVAFALPE